jgi:GNAT superfamily N-acetyltransferase
MGEEFNITVGPLRQAGLADAVLLAANEGWNQTEADWRRIQRLCPQGCFAALSQTTLVGTVTTIRYQQELAWLGMMLVKQGYRGRGIGKRLVSACLNFCKDAGIKTVKLDATPAGKPLYTSCGFSSEATIERWEGVAQVNLTPAVRVVGLDDSMHRQLYDLDREAFRADRRELLDSLIEDGCGEAAVVAESSSPSLGGYGLARRGSRALYVGPIVAVDQLVALSILDAMLIRLQGKKVYLDLLIKTEVYSWALAHRGFVKQRSLTRMFWGKQTSGAMTDWVFAIAGPELG